MPTQRLDKILASTGKWSRKEAKAIVRAGRVLVDGVVMREPAEKFDPEAVQISADDESLLYRRTVWVMLNKPAGYVTTRKGGKGPNVMDLLPPELRHLFPVGRLDKNTEGLLLLTNDGLMTHALLSPRHHVDKVYHARVAGRPTDADIAAFRTGLTLADGLQCLPAELEILSPPDNGENVTDGERVTDRERVTDADAASVPDGVPDADAAPESVTDGERVTDRERVPADATPPKFRETLCRVTVREGKYHQVKRMFQEIGKPVRYLERVKMGNLPLDSGLKRGSFRFLTEEEVENLGISP